MAHSSHEDGDSGRGGPKFYPEEELAELVRSLDRPEDRRLFSEDVLVTYPKLAAEYTKVCPQRCDLATAAHKALDGAYSHAPDLAPLKADVGLMVSNCVRFNGNGHPLSATAQDFERFALEAVRRYLDGKTGGRRTSSLRFLQTATTAGASPSATEDPFPRKELAQFVASLVRREDSGVFVADVAETYPELRAAYEAACPQRMNLKLMKDKALRGAYAQPGQPALGRTVADSLALLRADIELIVANCVTFNAQVETWVALARSFQAFAHRRVDELVLRRAPRLRGTPTGAERYAAAPEAAPPADTEPSSSQQQQQVAATPPYAAAAASGKRKSLQWSATGPSPMDVRVVADVAPSVRPTALQPELAVPPALRARLLADYLRRDSTPLRLVGATVPLAEVAAMAGGREQPREGGDSDAAPERRRPRSDNGDDDDTAASATAATVLLTPGMSARALLAAFRRSVEAFFRSQRTRPDFADPFEFSAREEASYLRVVRVVAEQFDALLPRALLYEREAAELRANVAARALRRATTSDVAGATDDDNIDGDGGRWAGRVHYCYLVRFLAQFPQLASLSAAGAAGGGRVKITREAVALMQYVAKVTQEFLAFAADFEAGLDKELAAAVIAATAAE